MDGGKDLYNLFRTVDMGWSTSLKVGAEHNLSQEKYQIRSKISHNCTCSCMYECNMSPRTLKTVENWAMGKISGPSGTGCNRIKND